MDGQCRSVDCDGRPRTRGLCQRCYKRLQREVGTGGRCSIEDCDRPAVARELCSTHYMRWYKKGTTADPVPATVEQRFWAKVDKDGPAPEARPNLGPCWLWSAAKWRNGYGVFNDVGSRYAHRFAYAMLVGPIPDGLTIDHLCRVRRCVRPEHLEAVTGKVNTLRGEGPSAKQARKTECHAGHPFDLFNTYIDRRGRRHCRACQRARDAGRATTDHRRTYMRDLAARRYAESKAAA